MYTLQSRLPSIEPPNDALLDIMLDADRHSHPANYHGVCIRSLYNIVEMPAPGEPTLADYLPLCYSELHGDSERPAKLPDA